MVSLLPDTLNPATLLSKRFKSEQIPDLTGRVALVTGGNGGPGLEAALAFLEAGARVVYCIDLPTQPSDVWTTVKEYAAATGLQGRLEYVQGDVTAQQTMWNIAQEIGDKEGRLDVCVAGAGITDKATPPLDYAAADYDKVSFEQFMRWALHQFDRVLKDYRCKPQGCTVCRSGGRAPDDAF